MSAYFFSNANVANHTDSFAVRKDFDKIIEMTNENPRHCIRAYLSDLADGCHCEN